MLEPLGIAFGRVLFAAEVVECALDQRPIAGVHRDHPRQHPPQQLDRIIPGQERVGGIVVDAEVWMVDGVDELTEDLHLLGKLGVLPEVVLVVVFQDQDDATVGGIGQAGGDRLSSQGHAFVDRELRPPLTGEHAAVLATERVDHLNPPHLLGDLGLAEGLAWVGEVGRTAEHGDGHPTGLHLLTKPRPGSLISHLKKACIPLKARHPQRRGELDPLGKRHAAIAAEGLHVGLGKGRELRGGCGHRWHVTQAVGGGGTVSIVFGGLRPMKGCCSRSTTWPLTGPHSSASQKIAAAAISSGCSSLPAGQNCLGR